MAINDFGEKIGGAKKDLWKERGGLSVEDLLDMNDAEKASYIKKDNIWQKPDYQSLVDEGVPVRVVYFMKKVRDATPVKPSLYYIDTPETIKNKQEKYVSFVKELKDSVLALKTEEDVLTFYKEKFYPKYLYRDPSGLHFADDLYRCCIDNKLLGALQVGSFYSIDRDIKKKQFCYSEEAKLKAAEDAFNKDYDIFAFDAEKVRFGEDYSGRTQVTVSLGYGSMFFYPQGDDADISTWEEGKYFVIRRGRVMARNLESRDEAKAFVHNLFEKSFENEAEQSTQKRKRKTRFTPKQLEGIKRDGISFRGGVHATGEKYMSVFGFKGGEFGNWMSENDRRASLDYGYDALMDMCKALNISTKDISLGGRLSIAFGARGSGNALAHYEPLREVINLTKMRGAGSLAHEWAHALDDIFGKALGLTRGDFNYMTENAFKPQVPSAMKELVDAMKYKMIQDDESTAKQKADVERSSKYLRDAVIRNFPTSKMTPEQMQKLENLADTLVNNAKNCKSQFIECVMGGSGNGNKDIDALSEFRKEVVGYGWSKQQRIDFAHYQNNLRMKIEDVGKPIKVETNFYRNSKLFDKAHSKTDHGYWQSTVEMFARAFACYVKDRVEGRSDYLVGHADSCVSKHTNDKTGESEIITAFPVGNERNALNRCFDKLICQLKERDLLHDYSPEFEFNHDKKPSLDDIIRSSKPKEPATFSENVYGQLEFEL